MTPQFSNSCTSVLLSIAGYGFLKSLKENKILLAKSMLVAMRSTLTIKPVDGGIPVWFSSVMYADNAPSLNIQYK